MAVSEVGRTATGFSKSDFPPFVTQATSAAKPSTCSFSRSRLSALMKMGKYALRTLSVLIWLSNQALIDSQMAYEEGSRI
jgi:hypothetical protein